MTEVRKPESQSIGKCSELRQECRGAIFEKMDALHEKQMIKLEKIQTDVAFMKGKQESNPLINIPKKNGNGNGNGRTQDILIKFLIMWGPPFALIVVLGFISWMKLKGYL